jgi:anti-sigma B factor antagonist
VTEAPFELRSSQTSDAAVTEVVGEIDMGTAPRLEAAIRLAQESARLVVVDLSEVTFLDSSALNVLVRCQREFEVRGTALRIVNPVDHSVGRIFEISHLTSVLNLVESREEALG